MARKKASATRTRRSTKAKPAAHHRKHSPASKRRKVDSTKRESHDFETLIEIFPPGVD